MTRQNRIFAIGAAHWDILGRADMVMKLQDDRPGRIYKTLGGVAGPIAVKLARMGVDAKLFSYIGRDELGDALIALLKTYNVDISNVTRREDVTDVYLGIEAQNGLIAAISDARHLEAHSEEIIDALLTHDFGDSPVIVDGNIHKSALQKLAHRSEFAPHWLCLVPASPGKIDRLTPFLGKKNAHFYLNLEEANLLCGTRFEHAKAAACAVFKRGAHAVMVSNGEGDCAYKSATADLVRSPRRITVRRVTGAGDTLTAHHIHALMHNFSEDDALEAALETVAKFMSKEDDQND